MALGPSKWTCLSICSFLGAYPCSSFLTSGDGGFQSLFQRLSVWRFLQIDYQASYRISLGDFCF